MELSSNRANGIDDRPVDPEAAEERKVSGAQLHCLWTKQNWIHA